jgi:anhydro-N-acetylmuramic acid kinase
MVYRVIGLMSGSSLDGLDMVLVEFDESGGKWQYVIKAANCYSYDNNWITKLRSAISLNAAEYQLLHAEYGHYIGETINNFIITNGLQYQVQLIASHGHTTFHMPAKKMTAQLGDGAAIAAVTGINVVSDLRAMDVALGGQGAPIVPIGEKLLLGEYTLFLNLGGIANISLNDPSAYTAFDVCPANRVLNMLANDAGKPFDEGGKLAATGELIPELLQQLNDLDYYSLPWPKSLANDFGTDVVYPLIRDAGWGKQDSGYGIQDALRTYTEHIVVQLGKSIQQLLGNSLLTTHHLPAGQAGSLLVTGGGAHNTYLIEKLKSKLQSLNVEVIIPADELINYKEAIIMALIGLLRWREEYNVLASVTGARRNSIGGAVWMGQEA